MPLPRRARRLLAGSALAALAYASTATVALPEPREPANRAAAGRILVTFRDGVRDGAMRAAHASVGTEPTGRLAAVRTDVVEVDDVDAALAEYRARTDVEWAGRDGKVHALHHVADNRFPLQWNLQDVAANPGSMNWHAAYQDGFGSGVLVAVVDTGVGRALRGGFDGFQNEPFSGYDFVDRDSVPDDENGHGTHIAGTIAQRTANATTAAGASVAGVAPAAEILAVRVLDARGAGSVSNTVEGIVFATDVGAKVINLSLGGEFAKPLCDAVDYATARGAIVVAASGNESAGGLAPVAYPAACPGALAVGGHQWDGGRGEYSNGSCELALTAPGGDLSDDPGVRRDQPVSDPRNGILQEARDQSVDGFGFYYDSGSSMAAAHAAGAAAVLMGAPFGRSAADAAAILRATARDRGVPGADDEFGAGGLDLAAAVDVARSARVPLPADRVGYWMVASDGGLFAFGDAPFLGSTGNLRLNSPIIGMARTPTGRGYWMVAADGGVFAFGDARFLGSAGGLRLKAPIVGIAAYPNGNGYWLVASDGGIFAFGEDRFFGSTGATRLNEPIVGMASTRTGAGYWLVARDGGVFSFGDATFHGSTGNIRLNQPIVGLTRTPSGGGYWMFATDGGIFAFGDAPFHGSTGDIRLNRPIVAMASTCYGGGYWLVASDGGVFAFGAAPFLGSTGDIALNRPIVGAHLAIDHRTSQR